MILLLLLTYGTLDDCCLGKVMSVIVVAVVVVNGLLISIGGVSGSPLDQKLPEAEPVGVRIDADADADAGASAAVAVEEEEDDDDDDDDNGVVVCIGGRGRVY